MGKPSGQKLKLIGVLALLIALSSCSSAVRFSSSSIGTRVSMASKADLDGVRGQMLKGTASYYADKFHGRMTANGETFDMNAMTAAHKTLPFGARLLVRNLGNNRTVVVRINDRGPYVGDRIIDLSKAAAAELDMIRTGTAEVEIKVLD